MRPPPGRMPAAGRPTATDRPARATRRARHRPLSPATSCCRATAAIVGQALADGAVYVPTASYCDSPSMSVYRVDLATQAVTPWFSVPAAEGGGGGVWGWGGTAFGATADALYAVTANAFAGGSNTGGDFSE